MKAARFVDSLQYIIYNIRLTRIEMAASSEEYDGNERRVVDEELENQEEQEH